MWLSIFRISASRVSISPWSALMASARFVSSSLCSRRTVTLRANRGSVSVRCLKTSRSTSSWFGGVAASGAVGAASASGLGAWPFFRASSSALVACSSRERFAECFFVSNSPRLRSSSVLYWPQTFSGSSSSLCCVCVASGAGAAATGGASAGVDGSSDSPSGSSAASASTPSVGAGEAGAGEGPASGLGSVSAAAAGSGATATLGGGSLMKPRRAAAEACPLAEFGPGSTCSVITTPAQRGKAPAGTKKGDATAWGKAPESRVAVYGVPRSGLSSVYMANLLSRFLVFAVKFWEAELARLADRRDLPVPDLKDHVAAPPLVDGG